MLRHHDPLAGPSANSNGAPASAPLVSTTHRRRWTACRLAQMDCASGRIQRGPHQSLVVLVVVVSTLPNPINRRRDCFWELAPNWHLCCRPDTRDRHTTGTTGEPLEPLERVPLSARICWHSACRTANDHRPREATFDGFFFCAALCLDNSGVTGVPLDWCCDWCRCCRCLEPYRRQQR